MSNESISMKQLLNISRFFSNATVQRIIYDKENIESLSLEELKKICFELSANVKNRSPFLFSSPYVKYFKEYPQALKIINEFKGLNITSMNQVELLNTLAHLFQLYNYKLIYNKLVERYTIYTSTLYATKDILKCIDFANNNISLFDNNTIDRLNNIKKGIQNFLENIEYIDGSFEYKNLETIQQYVNEYNTFAANVWKSYVDDSISNKDEFRYLVHDGIIKGKKYYGGTLSTSLISNNHLTTFGEGYGIIVKPIIIESAVPNDNGTDNSATIENTNTKNGTRVIYLPQQVEQETIKNQCYSEIALSEHEIIGVFAINNHYNSVIKYIQARLLARRLKVPFVKIDSKTKSQKISRRSVNEEKTTHESVESIDKEMEEKNMNVSYEEMLINTNEQMKKIEREFLTIHPTIVDGKKKNYAFYNNRFCFRIEDVPEEHRHLYSSVYNSDEPLYYETDNVRQTNLDDMSKFPDFASKNAEYVKLLQTKRELQSQIEQKEKQKRQKQIKQNNDIRQVEKLLNIRISPTKTGYIDSKGQIHVSSKNTSELSVEESQIKAKLGELYTDGKIDLRTRNELQIAIVNQYASMRKNAPKPEQTSTRDDSTFEQGQAQSQTQQQTVQPKTEEQVDEFTSEFRKKHGYDTMPDGQKVEFDKRLEQERKKQQMQRQQNSTKKNVEKSDARKKLEDERRELRRRQFEERSRAMGLDIEQIANLYDLFMEQELSERQRIEMESEEIEHHNGMGM